MKQFPIRLIIICLIAFTCSCKNESSTQQTNTVTTTQFKVWGNCEMCKETIEGALKVDGISKANWDTETKQIQVTYDSARITLDQIQKMIAASGYDTEKYKSDETAYHNLPECCQYERK